VDVATMPDVTSPSVVSASV